MGLWVSLDLEADTGKGIKRIEVFSQNITHNLGEMADEAGIYMHVWRPEEIGIERAEQLIYHLRMAIDSMKRDKSKYIKLNAKNGWGTYDVFVPWLERYLSACEEYPNALVTADR